MDEHERASEYLLKIQDELDAMEKLPSSALRAALFFFIGALFVGSGLRVLWLGDGTSALQWILMGAVVTVPGIGHVLRTRDWYRRLRNLKRGIALFDKRHDAQIRKGGD